MSGTALCIISRKNKKAALSRLPTILLLGLPGSGKRTLGNRLRQIKDYSYINVGQLLRESRLSGGRKDEHPTLSCPELAPEITAVYRQLCQRKDFAPDIVYKLITSPDFLLLPEIKGIVLSTIAKQMISTARKCREYLLQGFPCNIDQFVWFGKKLSGKVHVAILLDIPVQSAVERTARRKLSGARWDDSTGVVLERIKIFQQSTKPLIEHLASAGKLIRISGLCDPEQICDLALEEIAKRIHGEARTSATPS